jgi:hypothetical protein
VYIVLRPKEREVIGKVLSGRMDPNKGVAKQVLSRPHCAVALESILDSMGLTDQKLTKRVRQVINRRPEKQMTKTGSTVSNQTTVDNNALTAIRLIWQAKGKFTEKHDVTHHGEMANMSDKQLDTLIAQGANFLTNKKNRLEN